MARPKPTMETAATTAQLVDDATAVAEARYEEVVSTAAVDRRLLRGPFASNVWGGRYEIDALGGVGAQGATFTGVDRKTGARVAVKLFDLGKAKDWKAQELFDREVATLQRLNHPGVPQFLDVLADDETGARALVMTWVAGESLQRVLQRDGNVPEKRLWGLLLDVAHVLAAVHGEGIVHRDIKPGNLILRPDGTIALVDFGGVGVVRAKAGSTVVGTFGYMAPEQLYGAQTPATDLYALGATVLTLATGKEPEEQPRDGLAIDVDAAAPFLSPALRGLLKALLSPDPKARPQDAAALLVELQRIAAGTTTEKAATRAKEPDVVYSDGSVRAIFHDDEVKEAVQATSGVFGILAAVVGVLAAVGIGRILLPLLLTVLSVFVHPQQRRKIAALKDIIERKSIDAQKELERVAVQSAEVLEELSHKDAQRRRDRQERARDTKQRRAMKESERSEREAEKRARRIERELRRRRDEFWR